MKKYIWLTVIVICVLAASGRIYMINKNTQKYERIEYPKGEIVAFEDNFFDTSDFHSQGYAAKVIDSWIEPLDEYYEQHNQEIPDEFSPEDSIYMVKVEFFNRNKTEEEGGEGIYLSPRMSLRGTNYMITVSQEILPLANPSLPASQFSLRPDSSLEVIVPYVIKTAYEDIEHVKRDSPMIIMSEYPEMRLLHTQ